MASGNDSVLDLSQVEAAPRKVKLPDGKLYDLADPNHLSPRSLQQLYSRYRRAQEIMGNPDANSDDVDEMLSLLIDVACVLLPGADRDAVAELGIPKLDRLIDHFSPASATDSETQEAEAGETTGAAPTSASS